MYGINTLPNYYSYSNGGYVPRQPYGLGSIVKKITKPISRVLDKVVPNEIKPALPFIAAAMPWLAGAGYLGTGLSGLSRIQSLALGAGSNLFSQLSQEGADKRGINPLSLGLSALSGALAVPGAGGANTIVGNIGAGTPESVVQAIRAGDLPTSISQIPGSYNSVLETIPKATSDLSYLQQAQNSIGNLFDTISKTTAPTEGQDILSMQTAKQLAGPLIGASTETSMRVAQDALDKYNAEQNALGQMGVADQSKRKAAVIHAMQLAGFDQTGIDSALGRLGLADGGIGYQYGGGTIGYANGGRAAYGLGGDVLKALGELSSNIKYGGGFKKGIARTYENVKKPILDRIARFGDDIDIKISNYDFGEDAGESYDIIVKPKNKKGEMIMNKLAEENPFDKKDFYEGIRREGNEYYLPQGEFATQYLEDALSRGAKASGVTTNVGDFYRTKDLYRTSTDPYGYTLHSPEQDVYEALSKYQKKADGGLMSLGGREMDFRDGGGFVPIGAKERADDVPARLSKNEFVFTAKAVRNAGDGDIKEGARRMYQIMKNLEARS